MLIIIELQNYMLIKTAFKKELLVVNF